MDLSWDAWHQFVQTIVLILDGNSVTCYARIKKNRKKKKANCENRIKCLKLIKWQRLLLKCATISEVPSYTRPVLYCR